MFCKSVSTRTLNQDVALLHVLVPVHPSQAMTAHNWQINCSGRFISEGVTGDGLMASQDFMRGRGLCDRKAAQ